MVLFGIVGLAFYTNNKNANLLSQDKNNYGSLKSQIPFHTILFHTILYYTILFHTILSQTSIREDVGNDGHGGLRRVDKCVADHKLLQNVVLYGAR